MSLLSKNQLWEQFATRTLYMATYGGADFGECFTTMQRIGDEGDATAWHREWTATADRLAAAARESEDAGHVVSARDAYLRAATYYRTSYQPLFGAPVDPRLVDAFGRESAALESMVRVSGPDLELVEIPFEDGSLPGLFARGLAQTAPEARSSTQTGTTRISRRCSPRMCRQQSPGATTFCYSTGPARAAT